MLCLLLSVAQLVYPAPAVKKYFCAPPTKTAEFEVKNRVRNELGKVAIVGGSNV